MVKRFLLSECGVIPPKQTEREDDTFSNKRDKELLITIPPIK